MVVLPEASAPSDDELWQWALARCRLFERQAWVFAAFGFVMMAFDFLWGHASHGFGVGWMAMWSGLALVTNYSALCWGAFGHAPQLSYWARVRKLAPTMVWIVMGALALWGAAESVRGPVRADDWPGGTVVLSFAGVGAVLGLALGLFSARLPDMAKLRRRWEGIRSLSNQPSA